jgi:hypothetical protein
VPIGALADWFRSSDKLAAKEQQALLRFLLCVVPTAEAELPAPRPFSQEKIQGWLGFQEHSHS